MIADSRWKKTTIEWLFGEWTIRKNSSGDSPDHIPPSTPRPSIADGAMHQQPLLVSARSDHIPTVPVVKKCRGMSYGNVKE